METQGHRERRERRARERIELGKCPIHTKVDVNDGQSCEICNLNHVRAADRARAAGKCPRHPTTDAVNGKWCYRCSAKDKDRRVRAQNNGKCHKHPTRDLVAGKASCQVCLWRAGARSLKSCYGISVEDYATLEYLQNRVCALCKRPDPGGHSLAVDHEHVLGFEEMPPEQKRLYIRGLLCSMCNRLIGVLEKFNLLEVFKAYIDNPPARLTLS